MGTRCNTCARFQPRADKPTNPHWAGYCRVQLPPGIEFVKRGNATAAITQAMYKGNSGCDIGVYGKHMAQVAVAKEDTSKDYLNGLEE